jgi:hypothetical protein
MSYGLRQEICGGHMKRRTLFELTLLAFVAPGYAQFKFKSFEFPGSFLTTARGINNHGVIVGAYELPFQPRHALLVKDGTLFCRGRQGLSG